MLSRRRFANPVLTLRRCFGRVALPGPRWDDDGMTSGGDDIEKLLRELDAMEGGPPSTSGKQVQPKAAAPAAKASGKAAGESEESSGGGGRLAFAAVAAVVMGIVGALTGMVLGPVLGWLPLLDFGFWATGLGAAFGGFLTALVAGPPRWFSS
jgi:hypothetical protein